MGDVTKFYGLRKISIEILKLFKIGGALPSYITFAHLLIKLFILDPNDRLAEFLGFDRPIFEKTVIDFLFELPTLT